MKIAALGLAAALLSLPALAAPPTERPHNTLTASLQDHESPVAFRDIKIQVLP